MSKTAILPVLSVLALAISALTGHKFSNDLLDEVATIASVVITAGISVWGVFKTHQKKVDNPTQ